MVRRLLAGFVLTVGLTVLPLVANADPAPPAKATGRVVLDVQTIYGRPHKPLATIDVSRVTVKMPLTDPKEDFARKIEAATGRDPF